MTEHRVVDAKTGGAKGAKLARLSLVPWSIIVEVAEHFGRGARKYAERNWERGYAYSLSFDALHRHLEAFWRREDIDDDPSLVDEDGVNRSRHIIAVVWHALVLAYFSRYGIGTDDRPHVGEAPTIDESAVAAPRGRDSHPVYAPDLLGRDLPRELDHWSDPRAHAPRGVRDGS